MSEAAFLFPADVSLIMIGNQIIPDATLFIVVPMTSMDDARVSLL